jgi:hypothetical protein
VTPLRWELTPIARFADLREDWCSLASTYHQAHALLDVQVVETALKHLGTGEMRLAVGTGEDRVRAIAILQAAGPGRWYTFHPSQVPFTLFVADCPLLHAAQSLLSQLPGLSWQLNLMHVDRAYGLTGPPGPCVTALEYGLTMHVECSGSFDDYWAQRSRNLRKNIGRYQRRVARTGATSRLRTLRDPAAMRDAVRRYGVLESSGWKGRSGSAVHADNVQGAFYGDLLEQLAAQGGARVYELWFDDALVASRLTIVVAGMLVILKTAYDEQHARYAPGQLLLHDALREAFADDEVRRVEFYNRATPERLQWASDGRSISHYTLFRFRWIRQMRDLVHRLRHAQDQRARAGADAEDVGAAGVSPER